MKKTTQAAYKPVPLSFGDTKEFYAIGSIPLVMKDNSVILVSDGDGGRDYAKALQYADYVRAAVNSHEALLEAAKFFAEFGGANGIKGDTTINKHLEAIAQAEKGA